MRSDFSAKLSGKARSLCIAQTISVLQMAFGKSTELVRAGKGARSWLEGLGQSESSARNVSAALLQVGKFQISKPHILSAARGRNDEVYGGKTFKQK